MLLVVVILISMLVTTGLFLFRLDSKYEVREGAGRFVKLIHQVQVAEKAYRKHYKDRYRDVVVDKAGEMLNYLNEKGPIISPAKEKLSNLIRDYQESFEEIVALQDHQKKIKNQLRENVDDFESRVLRLIYDIQYSMWPLRVSKIRQMCLRLLIYKKLAIISKEENQLNMIFQYVSTYSPGLFGTLELSRMALSDDTYQKEVTDLIKTGEECVAQIRKLIELVHAENMKEEQFDRIAKSLTDTAESIQNQASHERDRLKTSTTILMLILISSGIAIIVVITTVTNRSITRPLNQMVKIARSIREGELEQTIDIKGDNEFSELAESINATTSHLTASLRLLEKEVADRKAAEIEIQALSRRMLESQENERAMIARELHDELAQMLTLLKIQTTRMFKRERIFGTGQNKDAEEILDSIDTLMDEIKELALRLRPKILDSMKLNEALRWMCQEFTKRTGIDCSVSAEEIDLNDQAVELTIFRVAQEGLTNVTRHSNANRVEVALSETEGVLMFQIRDNGTGCDIDSLDITKELGIAGIKERAKLIGGEIDIQTAPGQGFSLTLKVTMPVYMEKANA